MKRIHIAPLGCSLFVYAPNEKKSYEKKFEQIESDCLGEANGNIAWVSDLEHCQHEAVHLADWVIEEHLRMKAQKLVSTGELRAYLTEWITKQMERYVEGKQKKTKRGEGEGT